MNEVEEASSIAILGYGFPKTDAMARIKLLDSLSRCADIKIDLVLGPDLGLPANRRVYELLRYRARRSGGTIVDGHTDPSLPPRAPIRHHQLWAEDFIGDYVDRTLW